MASSSSTPHLLLSIFLFSLTSVSQSRPKALVVPVSKDASTLQYIARISQRTPLVQLNLVVDLGGRFLWVDCDDNYISSTYHPVRCRSAQCNLANSHGCNNNTCGVSPYNPITLTGTVGEAAADVLVAPSTDGTNPGPLATDPEIVFSCAPNFLLKGLPAGVKGMAGLGRSKIGLPTQLAAAFSFHRKFAICLSSSTSYDGVIFFGDGPYNLLPDIDASQLLTFTPLIINPVSTAGSYRLGEASVEYFITVKSIKINDKTVPINKTLLSIDRNGIGGTKISTVTPYTTLQTSIHNLVTATFARELANVTRVAATYPFKVCYDANDLGATRVGFAVPQIDLVLHSESVYWSIFGANSMVTVNDDVACLGVVDGGVSPRTSIVIGGLQLENNLLQFDLAASRLGFSSTLFFSETTCANFNFTSS